MKKKCNFCGHQNFRVSEVQYIYKQDRKFFVVNGVPCEECEFCKEQYFQASVLKKIEREFVNIYSSDKKKIKMIKVPIEEFEEITA
ncbi:MAG: YgiT-type zinc finger protein [Chlamydiae bacterium]|nr:YgiT-type zinc finger protein [Chlamydiota bacterium]MBI3276946.1 YgiT-type zinc finger protein [Chlamydiota bacterium]